MMQKCYTFLTELIKMSLTGAQQAVLLAMHERGEATRPQLAQATGLSLVSVCKAVDYLCQNGELRAAEEVPSGGGRPVMLYRYNVNYARHALIECHRQGTLLNCRVNILDLHGHERRVATAQFAYLEKESLDGILSETLRNHRLRSITLIFPADIIPEGMVSHLQSRYKCPVNMPGTATILAQGATDGTVVLCLQPGDNPSCAIVRGGAVYETGPLHLLTMPADWITLDYSDRVMVEEMTARLLQVITCTLAPHRIELYVPPMSSRLAERIRYNSSTKLRGALPELRFNRIRESEIKELVILYASRPSNTFT